jgi:hypothetical protein
LSNANFCESVSVPKKFVAEPVDSKVVNTKNATKPLIEAAPSLSLDKPYATPKAKLKL